MISGRPANNIILARTVFRKATSTSAQAGRTNVLVIVLQMDALSEDMADYQKNYEETA